MGIKLLFWLLMASKNPCGITCNCWTKTKTKIELKTELDYFVKQYALGHFSPPCSSQTKGYCWQNNLIMIMLIVKNGRSIQINCLILIRTITQELTWQTAMDITSTHMYWLCHCHKCYCKHKIWQYICVSDIFASISGRWKRIYRAQLFVNMSSTQMYWHNYLNILNMLKDS
jgi:hypothetical protein